MLDTSSVGLPAQDGEFEQTPILDPNLPTTPLSLNDKPRSSSPLVLAFPIYYNTKIAFSSSSFVLTTYLSLFSYGHQLMCDQKEKYTCKELKLIYIRWVNLIKYEIKIYKMKQNTKMNILSNLQSTWHLRAWTETILEWTKELTLSNWY